MSISCLNGDIEIKYESLTSDLSGPSKISKSFIEKPLLSYTNTFSDRYTTVTNKGMLTNDALDDIIFNIIKDNIIPKIPDNATRKDKDDFDTAQKKLKKDITTEYQFYYCRYIYCLNNLFTNIRLTTDTIYINGSQIYKDNINTTINTYLGYTKDYNKKLNDLIRIINALNESIKNANDKTTQTLSTSDETLDKLIDDLREHNDKLSGKNTVTNLRKDMVKYTEEKGRYTDNLLKMYSVLNIVALGLLVYVYKSAS